MPMQNHHDSIIFAIENCQICARELTPLFNVSITYKISIEHTIAHKYNDNLLDDHKSTSITQLHTCELFVSSARTSAANAEKCLVSRPRALKQTSRGEVIRTWCCLFFKHHRVRIWVIRAHITETVTKGFQIITVVCSFFDKSI